MKAIRSGGSKWHLTAQDDAHPIVRSLCGVLFVRADSSIWPVGMVEDAPVEYRCRHCFKGEL